jgi:hypothetical protein
MHTLPSKSTVQADEDNLLELALGWLVYSKAQVEEFLKFQDSQGTQRVYLVETVGVGLQRLWRGRVLGTQPRRLSESSPSPHQCHGLVACLSVSTRWAPWKYMFFVRTHRMKHV